MYLRKLMDKEVEIIKTLKQKVGGKRGGFIGKPVRLTVAGNQIVVEYERLKKLDKLLNPDQWFREIQIKKDQNGSPVLELNYRKHNDPEQIGTINLYGLALPFPQSAIYEDLPIIEIE